MGGHLLAGECSLFFYKQRNRAVRPPKQAIQSSAPSVLYPLAASLPFRSGYVGLGCPHWAYAIYSAQQ